MNCCYYLRGHDAWGHKQRIGRSNPHLWHGELRASGLSPSVQHLCSVSLGLCQGLTFDFPYSFGRATRGVARVSVGRWFWIVCTFCSAWLTAALSGKKV